MAEMEFGYVCIECGRMFYHSGNLVTHRRTGACRDPVRDEDFEEISERALQDSEIDKVCLVACGIGDRQELVNTGPDAIEPILKAGICIVSLRTGEVRAQTNPDFVVTPGEVHLILSQFRSRSSTGWERDGVTAGGQKYVYVQTRSQEVGSITPSDQMLAFAMCHHRRLGADSPARILPPELLELIQANLLRTAVLPLAVGLRRGWTLAVVCTPHCLIVARGEPRNGCALAESVDVALRLATRLISKGW